MAKDDSEKITKKESLKRHGTLHSRPSKVKDPLFNKSAFFDPLDLLQVKYEMVRKVQKEGEPIAQTASNFGFSRPAFYEAQRAFEHEGLVGLIPKKRGPQAAHKLSASIVAWAQEQLQDNSKLKTAELLELIKKKFGITVHSRSIERALVRSKKK